MAAEELLPQPPSSIQNESASGRIGSAAVHKPNIDVRGNDRRHGKGDADLKEIGILDRMALPAEDADAGDVGGRPNGGAVAAERRP